MKRFEKHVFICENKRPPENPKGCCFDKGSSEIRELFKKRLHELGIKSKDRTKKIIKLLRNEYPEVEIALEFYNPFQLLIATILSAQCTDERVNVVTKDLFKKYKSPKDFFNVR